MIKLWNCNYRRNLRLQEHTECHIFKYIYIKHWNQCKWHIFPSPLEGFNRTGEQWSQPPKLCHTVSDIDFFTPCAVIVYSVVPCSQNLISSSDVHVNTMCWPGDVSAAGPWPMHLDPLLQYCTLPQGSVNYSLVHLSTFANFGIYWLLFQQWTCILFSLGIRYHAFLKCLPSASKWMRQQWISCVWPTDFHDHSTCSTFAKVLGLGGLNYQWMR